MIKFLAIFHFLHTKKLLVLPFVIFILLYFYSFFTHELVIYPGISKDKLEVFTDTATGGNSQIDLFKIDSSGITTDYTLKDKIQYPYAGLKLILKKDSVYKDLSAYDYFSIALSVKTTQDLNVYFHTIIPGYTQEKTVLSYRYLLKNFQCHLKSEHFTVPLKSFAVPTWWYVLNKFPDDSLPAETFEEVAEIIIENGYNNQINEPYGFTLKKLSLQKNMTTRAISTGGACAGWLLVYGVLYLIYKKSRSKQNKKTVLSWEPLNVGNDSDESLNRIIAYIAKEYSNSQLTVNLLAKEVGLLPAKITQLLREKKNCSYKQYLNTIRLAEAKRLLLETDRNIVDIAQKVGYNNVTHFNRIFKETEGTTPRNFRISASKDQKG